MKIVKSTQLYEQWLSEELTLVSTDLQYKHDKMALNPFAFMRATFYRWAQLFPELCPDLVSAPVVLSVADLHVEQYSSWRDAEGRLVWGINDFDEVYPLPYTNDLVRLATSAFAAQKAGEVAITQSQACSAILSGYLNGISSGGKPFVLQEQHTELRAMAVARFRDPAAFWQKLETQTKPIKVIPKDAVQAIESMMPGHGLPYRLFSRRAGAGSLGRQRFVAIADYLGGRIAREVKALAPSAWAWAISDDTAQSMLHNCINTAVRCTDPFLTTHGNWVVRRLAPDCSRIELTSLPKVRDESDLLEAMGFEAANIHLGTKGTAAQIQRDLKKRPAKWLLKAATIMLEAQFSDFTAWRAAQPG